MEQLSLNWDARESERRKERGRDIAAANKAWLLNEVRKGVESIARSRESLTATADDAARWLVENGYRSDEIGNAAGSLFRDKKKWFFTGRWTKSQRVQSHANDLRIWMLKS